VGASGDLGFEERLTREILKLSKIRNVLFEASDGAEALAFLRGARRHEPRDLDALALTAKAARELEIAHQALIAAHLEKELKSARVLREMR